MKKVADGPRPHVDVLVVCALKVEFEALRKRMAPGSSGDDYRHIGLTHFFARPHGLRTLVVRLPEPGAGNVTSASVTASLLPAVDPWLVVSFGIAGTLDKEEAGANETVFARAVHYIDLRKDKGPGSTSLKQVVPRETDSELLGYLGQIPVSKRAAGVRELVIASSEAVVNSDKAERRATVELSASDAKVVEMEAFGAYQACHVEQICFGHEKRLCVALKGISDAADIAKDNKNHLPAANSAADFLFRTLGSSRVRSLQDRHGARPRRFRRVEAVKEADGRAKELEAEAGTLLAHDFDRALLHAAHVRCRRPRVFYHWRLTAMGLHWVELMFVRVFRRLTDLGYPVECLVTDEFVSMPHVALAPEEVPRARRKVGEIVRRLLPGADLTFLSDVRRRDGTLASFGVASGCENAFISSLADASPGMLAGVATTTLNLEFDLWLKYIAWRSRDDGTCVVFHGRTRRSVYSLLWHFADLVPALVSTSDILLGGEMGKTEAPGRDLVLLPPRYAAISGWLRREQDPGLLEEFWRRITERPDPGDAFIRGRVERAGRENRHMKPIAVDPAWIAAFRGGSRAGRGEFFKGAIAVELARWNELFEQGTVE